METKHKPATPLPFDSEFERMVLQALNVYLPNDKARKDAAYIAHAVKAYPRLVDQIRRFVSVGPSSGGEGDNARALLHDLGEV